MGASSQAQFCTQNVPLGESIQAQFCIQSVLLAKHTDSSAPKMCCSSKVAIWPDSGCYCVGTTYICTCIACDYNCYHLHRLQAYVITQNFASKNSNNCPQACGMHTQSCIGENCMSEEEIQQQLVMTSLSLYTSSSQTPGVPLKHLPVGMPSLFTRITWYWQVDYFHPGL